MKKFLGYLIVLFGIFSLSSCIYTDDTYVPQPPAYYNTRTIDVINYVQRGNYVTVNFNAYSPNNDYYYLVVEDIFGNILLNGRRWRKVSDNSWFSSITIFVDYFTIYPNTMYRCVVISGWGNYSQEFNMYVY